MPDVSELFVSRASSIRDAIACIDRTANGIALVVDGNRRLIGTVTDGDVRRAILYGVALDATVGELLGKKSEFTPKTPTTAPVGTPTLELLEIMKRHALEHIPLIDEQGCVADIALLKDLALDRRLPLRALVMAGGFGTRLKPLTDDRPKSMLPVGDRPLLEVIVEQLEQAGIRQINLATHYRADMIESHFGDGRQFNVDIQYVNEGQPLGTAGALGLLNGSDGDEPILVINGDIVTHVNFRSMLDFHRANAADMTVAVRPFEIKVPYGVMSVSGVMVTGVSEKPVIRTFVNAGIYLVNSDVRRVIANGERCDMTDIIGRLLAANRRVVSFPLREYWIDIGQADDYARAVADAEEGKG
jgi:dTDP-glucose pyrophosphorylase